MTGQTETWHVDGQDYLYTDRVNLDAGYRESFDLLAQQTFGISFAEWYRRGFWHGQYVPNALVYAGNVVSNVSVNIIDARFEGQRRRYIQLGTVMTDEAFREHGLASRLLARVMDEWHDRCDGIYLYANNGAKDFYPRFGFTEARYYRFSMPLKGGVPAFRPMRLDQEKDLALLLRLYARANPYSALTMLDNPGLLMFHCMHWLAGGLYYSEAYDAVVLASHSDGVMICHDIFTGSEAPLTEILAAAAGGDTHTCVLGFTPLDPTGFTAEVDDEEDTTLFVLGDSMAAMFTDNQLRFPDISRA